MGFINLTEALKNLFLMVHLLMILPEYQGDGAATAQEYYESTGETELVFYEYALAE